MEVSRYTDYHLPSLIARQAPFGKEKSYKLGEDVRNAGSPAHYGGIALFVLETLRNSLLPITIISSRRDRDIP